MTENEIARHVVDAAVKVHKEFGPGLLEAAYEMALFMELQKRGLHVERQVPIAVHYDGVKLEMGYRADLIVENRVILEVKSIELVPPVAYQVLLTYLRFANMKLGILLNFGCETMKEGLKRVVNGL